MAFVFLFLVLTTPNGFMNMSANNQIITLGGEIIGTQTGISWSVQTDKRPQYQLNSINPESFSTGITIVTGEIQYAVLSDTLLSRIMKNGRIELNNKNYIGYGQEVSGKSEYDLFNNAVTKTQLQTKEQIQANFNNIFKNQHYIKKLDELPPLELMILNSAIKDGKSITTKYKIIDTEITQYSFGITIADIIAAEQVQFIALDYYSENIV